MEGRNIVNSQSRTRTSRGVVADKPWVTALFTDRAQADHMIEDWRSLVVVCEKGELRQGYTRGRKPLTSQPLRRVLPSTRRD